MIGFYTILFNVFNGLMAMYTNYIFFDTFSKPKKFRFKWAYLLGLSAIFVSTLLFTDVGILRLAILFAVVFLTSLTFKMHWYIHILLSVATILLSSLVEQMVAIFGGLILGVETEVIKTGYYFIIFGFMAKLLAFGIVAILRTGKHAHISGIIAPVVFIGFLPITSFMVVMVMIDYINKINEQPFLRGFTIATLLFVCLANVLAFYVVDKVYANMQAEQDLKIANQLIEHQRQQYQNLYDSQKEIKKLKHDIKNVVVGVLSQLKSGEVEPVINKLENNLNHLSDNNIISGNQTVDTILNVKIQEASRLGIKIIPSVKNADFLSVDPVDFSIMLGNAIDNAIEATQLVTNQEKEIDISIYAKPSDTIIVVKNPVIKKIDVENMETSKKDKSTHGFGVLQIKSLVVRYDGEVFFECSENEFKCSMVLKNKINA